MDSGNSFDFHVDFKNKSMKMRAIEKKQVTQEVEQNNTEKKLIKLKELFEKGLITEEEYQQKKDEVLKDF